VACQLLLALTAEGCRAVESEPAELVELVACWTLLEDD